MRERPIIMHLLTCFFYLLQINIISITSPKITLVLLFIICFCLFVKKLLFFILRKISLTKTGAARLFPPALHVIINPVQITGFFNILVHNLQTITWLFLPLQIVLLVTVNYHHPALIVLAQCKAEEHTYHIQLISLIFLQNYHHQPLAYFTLSSTSYIFTSCNKLPHQY